MVAFPFSRGSSQPRDQILVSCLVGGFFTAWATREALETAIPSLYFVVRFKVSRWKVPNIGMTQWVRAIVFVIIIIIIIYCSERQGLWYLLGIFEFRHFVISGDSSRSDNHLQFLPTGLLTLPVFILSSVLIASGVGAVEGVAIVSPVSEL